MALKIKNLPKAGERIRIFTLKERTYVTRDGKRLAKGGEPKMLLGGEGTVIMEDQAIELGLLKGDKPAEDKGKKPAEDKGKKPAEDK